jgi:GTP-binding protein
MADWALLLVDAQEGPMPQTYFVLKKSLALALPIIVVINKIDKPAARPEWAVDQVFDLFVKLNAPDHILDFPVIFASAKNGYTSLEAGGPKLSMEPLFEKIISHIPAPAGDPHAPLQMLVSSIEYSPYLGRLGLGKITGGTLNINKEIVVAQRDGTLVPARISKVYRFEGAKKSATDIAGVGEIVAVAGMDDVTLGVTFTDPDHPMPLPPMEIDPCTISIHFIPNESPFAGTEGSYATSQHLTERLKREALSDAALQVEEVDGSRGFKVSGRGELHLSILIEKMRREGYEFEITRPQVIMKEEDGRLLEPIEELTIDVDKAYMGTVIEKLGARKGQMLEMRQENGMARLTYRIPTRGLLGFRSEFLTDTKGMGVMNYRFLEYGAFAGDIRTRTKGVMVAKEPCTTVAYALFNLQDRGRLFYGPGTRVYQGQIIGEHCRPQDLLVNPAKGKKLTNVRASGSDENVILTPPIRMSLEQCIAYINEDELVEVTPQAIRLRR